MMPAKTPLVAGSAAAVTYAPGIGPVQMTLIDLLLAAVDHGGDAVGRALGHTDAQLVRDPHDPVARAAKGALLTLVVDDVLTPARRDDYRHTGMTLMHEVLAQLPAFSAQGAATRFVIAVGLAGLPASDGQRDIAEQILRRLVNSPEWAELQPVQRLRVQVTLAGLAQLAGNEALASAAYAAARTISPDHAVHLFCAFMERQGGAA